MRVLPHTVQCTSRMTYGKVSRTNKEFLSAKSQFVNLGGCTLMTRLLTIALQGDSWSNQDGALTPTGHSDSQIRPRAQLTFPSAVPHAEEAQLTYQRRGSAWPDTQCFHLLNKTPVMLSCVTGGIVEARWWL